MDVMDVHDAYMAYLEARDEERASRKALAEAVRHARNNGATLATLAEELEMTRQAVFQLSQEN